METNLKILSFSDLVDYDLTLKYVENNPITPEIIVRLVESCYKYAKENKLVFKYPVGTNPIFFVFEKKKTPGRKKKESK